MRILHRQESFESFEETDKAIQLDKMTKVRIYLIQQNYKFDILLLYVVIHFPTYTIDRLTLVILQMNVTATYQVNKMVILQSFKKLMLKATYTGTEPRLEVRGATLLLVAYDGSSFRLGCLTANGFFFFFFLCFLCVHPGMDKIILFKIF